MKKIILVISVFFLSSCSLSTVNAQPQQALTGKEVFSKNCSQCHSAGIGYPGTQQLARTRGEAFSVLEERTDLNEVYIAYIVRNGLSAMTPFTPTEVTDEELERLTEYLTAK